MFIKSREEKILLKICDRIRDIILSSDCATFCWYVTLERKKIFPEKNMKETIGNLLTSIGENKVNFDNKTKLPVLHLSCPLETNGITIDKLYIQNAITVDFIEENKNESDSFKSEIKYLSFIFNCDEYIIENLNERDYKIAVELLNLFCIV